MAAGLEKLIGSLLASNFADFELLISDNASTDTSPAIIEAFVRSDRRVRSMSFASNQGVAANFNRVLTAATAPLFKWCAVGDLVDEGYLSTMVDRMERTDDLVFAHSRYDFFDGVARHAGGHNRRRVFDEAIVKGVAAASPTARVRANLNHFGYGGHIHGVLRRPLLLALGGLDDHAVSDRVLTSEMLAVGKGYFSPDILWSCYTPAEEHDYADYGLRDGATLPAIEKELLRRGSWKRVVPRRSGLLLASYLATRYGGDILDYYRSRILRDFNQRALDRQV